MNFTVARKISALVLVTLLGVVALAGMVWKQVDAVYNSANFATINTVPSLRDLDAGSTAMAQAREVLWQFLARTDEKGWGEAEQQFTTHLREASDALDKYAKEDMDEPPEVYAPDKANLDATRLAIAEYAALKDKVVALVRQGQHDDARDLLLSSVAVSSRVSTSFASHRDLNIRFANDAATVAASVRTGALTWSIATAVLTLLVSGVLALWISRSITGSLNEAVKVAQAVAAGDLSSTISVGANDEVGQLLMALQRMQQNLSNVVSSVRRGSESVATASAEISHGNSDLSGRTEQQASALEETASSLEQLNATVKQNADAAQQANQLAASASVVAVQGGEVVGQVVETMKGINDSSRKIGDIISVIDGIAFQTNILALNAAVEAARAGEQGRGFAVVASEVRSLAGRSAEAAKEIKALISASVEKVAQGTVLVDRAGVTMTEVVGSIRRVTDIMGEISAASREQANGMGHIGEAVNGMDHTTQQNAALVEQMAAAAASLTSQAQDLVQVVADFTLRDGDRNVASYRAIASPVKPVVATLASRGKSSAVLAAPRPSIGASAQPSKPAPALAAKAPAKPPAKPAASSDDGDWETF